MIVKHSMSKRITSAILALAILFTTIPFTGLTVNAVTLSQSSVTGTVADPGTADTWEQMMGSSADGNRYAGRVWVDKSVYKDGDTAVLNNSGEEGSSFEVSLEDDEAFQVIFSALGSSMTTTTTISSSGPMDVVIVLDNSSSMGRYTDASTKYSRLEAVTDASNKLIDQILSSDQNRLAIVTYSTDSTVLLPLNYYEQNAEVLTITPYYEPSADNGGGVRVEDGDGKLTASATILGTTQKAGSTNNGFQRGTNLQSGIDEGMKILNEASDVSGRTPVVIVLTDGVADTAVTSYWYDTDSGDYRQPSDNNLTEGVALSTLLNAAYGKAALEDTYGKAATVYGIGVDLDSGSEAEIVMNPAKAFNATEPESTAGKAYKWFTDWQNSTSSVTGTDSTNTKWTFNQLPSGSTVTKADVVSNINYVDTYYPVSSADVSSVFDQIYEELTSGVFNPISSTTTVDGATGVDNTPLIYVDWIGQYMEVKEIQSVTLFGNSYAVVNNGDGTYTVATGTGKNPTTNEDWNTTEDITIKILEDEGVQKLEIRINQEILPILMEQVISKTVNGTTTATITEIKQNPLRVYYTVGLDSDILLPNGEIDVSKIQGYQYIDNDSGTVSFYSNRFGVRNAAVNNIVTAGDAHVGFKPSEENRYYYHQQNQRIFSSVSMLDGTDVPWESGLYGALYQDDKYELTDIDYATYVAYNAALDDENDPVDHVVYTYVNFYRPTTSANDAANAAERVSYLVYTNWSDLRESAAFYDAVTGKYVNYNNGEYTLNDVGYVMTAEQAAGYVAANPNAELYVVLGVNSLRTSRFHNMIKEKTENLTDTATLRYAPEYTYGTAADHHGNDVVVWLGNNGKLTVAIDTGIALTKNVTETIGNADDTYAVTVTVPAGVTANPVVTDVNGNNVTATISTYSNNVLTVNLKAGETVYISGIPSGTECVVDEIIPDGADYYIASKTEKVTVPALSDVLNGGAAQFASASVINAPNKYGNLYITKEITGDYTIPASILEKEFTVIVKDITLSGSWTPITSFSGSIDGHDHTITNLILTYSSDSTQYGETETNYGFVRVLTGTIKNVTFNKLTVDVTKYKDGVNDTNVGGVVGYLNGGTLSNVRVVDSTITADHYREVSASGAYVNTHTGGLIGRMVSGTVENCSIGGTSSVWGKAGKATDSADAQSFVGGIVGYQSGGTVTGCTRADTATVTARSRVNGENSASRAVAGGITGRTDGGMIVSCTSTVTNVLGSWDHEDGYKYSADYSYALSGAISGKYTNSVTHGSGQSARKRITDAAYVYEDWSSSIINKEDLSELGYTKVNINVSFWVDEINQGNQRVYFYQTNGTQICYWSFDSTPSDWHNYSRTHQCSLDALGENLNFVTAWEAYGNGDDDWDLGGTTITYEFVQ